jgi:hypothetical protein
MPVVAPALPAAAAASVHSVESPAQNAAAGAVGPTGATPDQVRQALNATNLSVTGAGFTVGVLSDSFDYLGGAAADEADGALPPASQVQVVKDLPNPNNPPGTDEGRAMMQIVHDVAPDANLSFYTAFVSEQDFAAGILALANSGCSVICDDVGYFAEPFYQTGVVGNAIQTVEQEGVIYLTSAGNSDAVGYQAAWTPIPTRLSAQRSSTPRDFAASERKPSRSGQPERLERTFAVQWGHPRAVTSDLEVVVFLNNVVVATVTGNGRDPYIIFSLPQGNTYTIAIQNLSGPDPGLIKEAAIGSGLVTINGANSGTTQGHQISPYALAEGAVDSRNHSGPGRYAPERKLLGDRGRDATLVQ